MSFYDAMTGFSEINHSRQINYTTRKHKSLFREQYVQRRIACGRSFFFSSFHRLRDPSATSAKNIFETEIMHSSSKHDVISFVNAQWRWRFRNWIVDFLRYIGTQKRHPHSMHFWTHRNFNKNFPICFA